MVDFLKTNRTRVITLAVLAFLFFTAVQGMDTQDWVITVLRGLSVGAITFLVAAGFSLILGLMNILNLAHGEMFMIGAYVGWTVFVRPDTIVDVLPPLALLAVGLLLMPLWRVLLGRLNISAQVARIWPWVGLGVAGLILWATMLNFPIAMWDAEVYQESPTTFSLNMSQGMAIMPDAAVFEGISPLGRRCRHAAGRDCAGGSDCGVGAAEPDGRHPHPHQQSAADRRRRRAPFGLVIFFTNNGLTTYLFEMNTTGRFLLAMLIATSPAG
jgi:hypothetical protein